MPVSFLSYDQRENYGSYVGPPSPHDLARYFHRDDTDHALIAQKRGTHNRLGSAIQLGPVRYLGTFLEDPLAVPQSVLRTRAKSTLVFVQPVLSPGIQSLIGNKIRGETNCELSEGDTGWVIRYSQYRTDQRRRQHSHCP